MSSSIVSTFVGAIQASASVLLTIFYGVIAGQTKLLSVETGRQISKICIKMFLPALLIVNLGTQIEASNASLYLTILSKSSIGNSEGYHLTKFVSSLGTRLQPCLHRRRIYPHKVLPHAQVVHTRHHL